MGMKGRSDVGSSRVRVGSATGGGLSDELQRKMSTIERRLQGRNGPTNGSLKGESATHKDPGKSSRSSCVGNSSATAATILCADEKSSIADCSIGDNKQFVEGAHKNPKRGRASLGSSHDFSEISDKFVDSEAFLCGSEADSQSCYDERVKKLAKTGPCLRKANMSLLQNNCIHNHSDDHETASPSGDIQERESSPQPALSPSPSPSAINMLPACRSIDEFQRVSKISEGTYGVVSKAQDKKTGEFVAIKKVKMDREKEGFPITSLREINILLSMDHPSIVVVKGIAVDKDFEGIYMVMEHIEQDLAGLLASHKGSFSQGEVKFMMLQLLEGIEYVHSKWVLHRDLKPSNLLVDSQGMLKICDFGLARQFGSPLKAYTHKVVSLWYRDPALLLGPCKYSTAVDMWSLGCIMAELLGKVPLFEGCGELDQLKKIVAILGSPDETVLKDKLSGVLFNFLKKPSKSMLRERFPPTSFAGKTPLSEKGFNLLSRLLMYDPNERISAEDAVRHDWFREDPLPKPLTLSS